MDVVKVTEGVRTWELEEDCRGRWVDDEGVAEGVFVENCAWLVLYWQEPPLS